MDSLKGYLSTDSEEESDDNIHNRKSRTFSFTNMLNKKAFLFEALFFYRILY